MLHTSCHVAEPERLARAKTPTDPMSFPPGLIPQLVREKLETDPPYSPLSTLEVDRLGLPEPTQPDAYLRARLDKFHAELKVPVSCLLQAPAFSCIALGALRQPTKGKSS